MCTKYLLKNKNIDHLSLKKKSGYAFFFGNYLSNTLQHNIFCSIVLFYRLQLRGHHEKEKKSNKICTITYILLQLLRLWQFYYNYNTITILFTFSTIKMFQKKVQKDFSVKDLKSPCSRIKRSLTQGSKTSHTPRSRKFKKVLQSRNLYSFANIFFSQKGVRLLPPKIQIA